MEIREEGSSSSGNVNYIKISDHKSLSKVAIKITIDPAMSECTLHNFNKNAIWVNRRPVGYNEQVPLNHMSLVQLTASDLFFFLLPHEAIDKKKRFIKERRKEVEQAFRILNPPRNEFEQKTESNKGATDSKETVATLIDEYQRRKVGLGKRLNLKEMLRLIRGIKSECVG